MRFFHMVLFVIFLISLLFKSPFVTLLSILDIMVGCPIINGIFACIFLMVRLALRHQKKIKTIILYLEALAW